MRKYVFTLFAGHLSIICYSKGCSSTTQGKGDVFSIPKEAPETPEVTSPYCSKRIAGIQQAMKVQLLLREGNSAGLHYHL